MGFFTPQEGGPGSHLLGMPLAVEALRRALALAMDVECLEVLQLSGESGAKDSADLFRPGAVAFGRIHQLSARAVSEYDLGRDAVREGEAPGRGPHRLGTAPHGSGIKQETEEVKEVTGLSEHAATAFGVVREPTRGLERPGQDPEAGRLRSGRRLDQFAQLGRGAGEAPVETDLDAAAALGQRARDLRELITGQAQRLFHKDVPVRA